MLKKFILFFAVGSISFFFSCSSKDSPQPVPDHTVDSFNRHLIPIPAISEPLNGFFNLDKDTKIYTTEIDSFIDIGKFLSEKIKEKTSLELKVNSCEINPKNPNIFIYQSDENDLGKEESYRLVLNEKEIILKAKNAKSAFRGIQTLLQLIPINQNPTRSETNVYKVPTGEIYDYPRFSFRGAMLDVARHFFKKEEVKRYIDLLAYYKFNSLHLHLSDDQGWRIEIKKWPKLTEIGSKTQVGGGDGGFYTQEDFKEIVQYAQERYMDIIPEIDMPGHTNAASAGYPFLNGTKSKAEPYTWIEVGFSSFDTRKDSVYSFVEDVISEISAISPAQYFHLGGDESKSTTEEDYLYFINKVAEKVSKYGKQVIGWGEIAKAKVPLNALAQTWKGTENIRIAEEKGLKIILSPADKCYLDMKYSPGILYGLSWAGYVNTRDAYDWKPEELSQEQNIYGIEAALWSETIYDFHQLTYLAFPRVIGHAEIAWSPKERRNWETYRIRLAKQEKFLDFKKINFYHSPLVDWK